jgi:hypothetical protein
VNFLEFEIIEFNEHRPEHMATFYSIKFKGENKSEADKFFEKFEDIEKEKIENISKKILLMIQKRGCSDSAFRLNESSPYNNICALWDGNLRLYCLRFGKVAVILGGGGIKDVNKYQDSEELTRHVKNLEMVYEPIINRIINEKELFVLDNKLEGNFKFNKEE